jgi:hypothetical protein
LSIFCSSVDRFGYHWYCDAVGACDVLGADLLEKEAATCCCSSWSRYGKYTNILIILTALNEKF